MANAQAIGPFLQGFAKPITDLSRGATVDEVVSTVILTLGQLL
jgi:phosphate acetyltransferase